MGQHRIPGPLAPRAGSTPIDEGTLARADSARPGILYGSGRSKGGSKEAGTPLSLGERVVQFAVSQLGQVVPNGECFALVDRALRTAGARSAADYGPVTGDVDYVWGQPVTLDQARPGDILQFRNFSSTVASDTGSEQEETTEERRHHSAILERNRGEGEFAVLEQNAPLHSPVHRTLLCMRGGHWEYPDETINVTVTGQFWIYRPVAAP